jgi:hypothetical protein
MKLRRVILAIVLMFTVYSGLRELSCSANSKSILQARFEHFAFKLSRYDSDVRRPVLLWIRNLNKSVLSQDFDEGHASSQSGKSHYGKLKNCTHSPPLPKVTCIP